MRKWHSTSFVKSPNWNHCKPPATAVPLISNKELRLRPDNLMFLFLSPVTPSLLMQWCHLMHKHLHSCFTLESPWMGSYWVLMFANNSKGHEGILCCLPGLKRRIHLKWFLSAVIFMLDSQTWNCLRLHWWDIQTFCALMHWCNILMPYQVPS